MNVIRNLRTNLLGVSQSELGEIAGVPQSVISRWETGQLEPRLSHITRIRAEALRRGLSWDDRWFFEPPKFEAAA